MNEARDALVRIEVISSQAAEPCAFFLRGQFSRVAEVTDRWPSGDHAYFKVRTEDGRKFVLRNDIISRGWTLAAMPTS
jgi:hypothetical protein